MAITLTMTLLTAGIAQGLVPLQDGSEVPPATTGPAVVISEIMYDPGSDEQEGQPEWVEIVNVTDATVIINNWRLTDEDEQEWAQWGAFSCELPPRGVAVLINGEATTEQEFRDAWQLHSTAAAEGEAATTNDTSPTVTSTQILAVDWGSLANGASAENEILQLVNADGTVMCEVNYEKGGTWPSIGRGGGPSIYLVDPTAADLNDGSVWKASSPGVDGAKRVRGTKVFNGEDVGSPGYVPRINEITTRDVPETVTGEDAGQQQETRGTEKNRGDDEIDY